MTLNYQQLRDSMYACIASQPIAESICFTGHRPQHLFDFDETKPENVRLFWYLRAAIEAHIMHGTTTFMTGMALGVDQWAGRVLLSLKQLYPHIRIIAAVPCINQDNRWSPASQHIYRHMLTQMDEIIYVSTKPYFGGCMQRRNQFMLEQSSKLIAIFKSEKRSGGTFDTVTRVQSMGKPVFHVHPVHGTFGNNVA